MLLIKNVSTGYGKKQVLFDVSIDIKTNDIVLIIGSNGSGKSTLMKVIYGLLPQWNSGSIFFNNEDITGKPTSTLLKKGLIYIPQNYNLFEDISVKDNLDVAGVTLNPKVLKDRIDNVLSIFPTLLPHLNRTPMKLSGGERRLLTLAMTLLHKPKMILIDEPFLGLSPNNVAKVTEYLKILNKTEGVTLVIVEHRIKESLIFVNKVYGLKLGNIVGNFQISENFNIDVLKYIFI